MNRLQVIIVILCIFLAIGGVFIFAGSGRPSNNPQQITGGVLTIWGTEPANTFTKVFKAYESQTKNRIIYTPVDSATFNAEILNAIASNKSPDAIIANIDWANQNSDKISPLPMTSSAVTNFKNTYVDSVSTELLFEKTNRDTKVTTQYARALPLWIDPLVLFWNKDIFNAGVIALPPANWEELSTISNTIKATDASGTVSRAGVAMGRAKNIPNTKDILALLMLQQGLAPHSPFFTSKSNDDAGKIQSAVRFYTDFANPGYAGYTWNGFLPAPEDLFATGKLGMMLEPLSRYQAIVDKNPHLAFNVTKSPQPKDSEVPIYTGDIIVITVPLASKHASAAWSFGSWMTEAEQAKQLLGKGYIAPARRDLYRDSTVTALPFFPILKEEALNLRLMNDPYPQESAEIIENIIESIVDKKLTISEGVKEAGLRIARSIQEHSQ